MGPPGLLPSSLMRGCKHVSQRNSRSRLGRIASAIAASPQPSNLAGPEGTAATSLPGPSSPIPATQSAIASTSPSPSRSGRPSSHSRNRDPWMNTRFPSSTRPSGKSDQKTTTACTPGSPPAWPRCPSFNDAAAPDGRGLIDFHGLRLSSGSNRRCKCGTPLRISTTPARFLVSSEGSPARARPRCGRSCRDRSERRGRHANPRLQRPQRLLGLALPLGRHRASSRYTREACLGARPHAETPRAVRSPASHDKKCPSAKNNTIPTTINKAGDRKAEQPRLLATHLCRPCL